MTFSCDVKDCNFTTDSKVGLGVHKSRSHDLQKFVDVSCEYCDTDFEKRRSEVERTDTHFCSRDCHFSWKSENKTGEHKILDCDYCDGETKVYPKELEQYEHHFCSQECKDLHHSNNYTGDSHWRHGNGGVDVSCDECGSEFARRPSRSNGKTFCSKSCEADYISERQAGSTNSNWAGGVGGQNYGSNWTQKREEALERDSYSCEECDMTREEHYSKYGKDLDVHHKIPIDEFDKPEDANYLINLVTTCRSCHGQLDTISRREANRKPTISV